MEEMDTLLRQWGALSKYTEERREAGGTHALERGRAFAPGTRARAAQRLVGRDGSSRRSYMARGLEACGVRMVGQAYVDPVPCTESRGRGGLASAAARYIPEHLRPVDEAARLLHRVDTLMGLCLRYEYCGYGSQGEKAGYVGSALGQPVGLRVYREALARAKGWMMGRLVA